MVKVKQESTEGGTLQASNRGLVGREEELIEGMGGPRAMNEGGQRKSCGA